MRNIGKFGLIAIGYVFGAFTYKLIFASTLFVLEDSIEQLIPNSALEAQTAMLTASHIRDNENKQAVAFLEKRIELEVISFTNKGRQVHELSPREIKILKAVKVYRDKKCSEKCLKEISYILDKL